MYAVLYALPLSPEITLSKLSPSEKQLFLANGIWLEEPALETYGTVNECCVLLTGSESRHYLYCSIFSTRLLNLNTETVHHLNVFVLCMPHFQAHDIKQQLLTLFVLHEIYPYQKLHNILLKCSRVYTRVSH